MLQASKHKKDRNLKLYEDEITSIIFGPLLYMPVEDVWDLIKTWISIVDESCFDNVPDDIEFEFWPNLSINGRIEPDLIINFHKDEELYLSLMFEVKWNSPISGEDELAKQWEALPNEIRRKTYHIYLVKKIGRGKREVDHSLSSFPIEGWSHRLSCVGWRDLVETLKYRRPTFGIAMNRWAEGVIAFLERRGQTTFNGFKWLEEYTVDDDTGSSVFWNYSYWAFVAQHVIKDEDNPFFMKI